MEDIWKNINLPPLSPAAHPPHLQLYFPVIPFSNNNLQTTNLPSSSAFRPPGRMFGGGGGEVTAHEEKLLKRKMKNLESAVRSRARKEAYVIQLEETVERLEEENARLQAALENGRKMPEVTAADAQLRTAQTIRRTLSAPY